MPQTDWLPSQLAYRTQTVPTSLAAAADQANICRQIAADLHADGKDHFQDPFWQSAARESHRLAEVAETQGFNGQDVMDEAARRRDSRPASGAIHTD